LSFKRLVQLLPGIGGKGADKLWRNYSAGGIQEPGLGLAASLQVPSAGLQRCAASVPKKTTGEWTQLVATFTQMEAADVRKDASKMIRLAVEAGYEDHLKDNYANYRSRLEDLEQLAVFARQFDSMEDFLTQLALLTNLDAEDE